jgi:hypothetical protein
MQNLDKPAQVFIEGLAQPGGPGPANRKPAGLRHDGMPMADETICRRELLPFAAHYTPAGNSPSFAWK